MAATCSYRCLSFIGTFRRCTRYFSSKMSDSGSGESSDQSQKYYENYMNLFKDYKVPPKSAIAYKAESEVDMDAFDEKPDIDKLDGISPSKPISQYLTHTDEYGRLKMVNVGNKPDSLRIATACSNIVLGKYTYELVKTNNVKKGDVLTVAKVAGIIAAKNTSSMIPLCHQIHLSKVDVEFKLNPKEFSVDIYCTAETRGKTGVEMEALVGASCAALTVYDMCKATNREMVIGNTRLLKKIGGVHGDYEYKPA